MTVSDLTLLGRKIFVGVVITAVPAALLIGGLWATQHVLRVHVKGKH